MRARNRRGRIQTPVGQNGRSVSPVSLAVRVLLAKLDSNNTDLDRGSTNAKVEPAPGVLETSTRPPCSSTNVLTSQSPSPIPRLPNW